MDLLLFIAKFDPDGAIYPDEHHRASWAIRIHRRIRFTDSCWEWIGALNHGGYGVVGGGTSEISSRIGSGLAHRQVYAAMRYLPADKHLDHLCRNRRCCNPEHLEPVSQQENNRRMFARKVECVNGHPYEGNRTKNGEWSRCRVCHAEQERARARKKQLVGATSD